VNGPPSGKFCACQSRKRVGVHPGHVAGSLKTLNLESLHVAPAEPRSGRATDSERRPAQVERTGERPGREQEVIEGRHDERWLTRGIPRGKISPTSVRAFLRHQIQVAFWIDLAFTIRHAVGDGLMSKQERAKHKQRMQFSLSWLLCVVLGAGAGAAVGTKLISWRVTRAIQKRTQAVKDLKPDFERLKELVTQGSPSFEKQFMRLVKTIDTANCPESVKTAFGESDPQVARSVPADIETTWSLQQQKGDNKIDLVLGLGHQKYYHSYSYFFRLDSGEFRSLDEGSRESMYPRPPLTLEYETAWRVLASVGGATLGMACIVMLGFALRTVRTRQ